ncbi:MAG: hypothetical protein C5B59_14095 [Bacteroidetes bacterium]|nr:MAG: hypothetical protein C5B59_14095 [Bacteroidota bacterium]
MSLKKCFSCQIMLVISVLALTKSQGQTKDTSFLSSSINNAISLYHAQINRAAGIYHGVEYEYYPYHFQEGTPYFVTSDSVAASIYYDGVLYQNMFMKYDQLRDQVIIWYNNDAVRLIDEKVDSFIIRDHLFVRLISDSASKNALATGYYEMIYNGKIRIYRKSIKHVLVKTDMTEGVIRTIDQKDNYFVRKSGHFQSIDNVNEWYALFIDHKDEIKEFVSRNNLNFKKDPAGWLVQVAAYCDKL